MRNKVCSVTSTNNNLKRALLNKKFIEHVSRSLKAGHKQSMKCMFSSVLIHKKLFLLQRIPDVLNLGVMKAVTNAMNWSLLRFHGPVGPFINDYVPCLPGAKTENKFIILDWLDSGVLEKVSCNIQYQFCIVSTHIRYESCLLSSWFCRHNFMINWRGQLFLQFWEGQDLSAHGSRRAQTGKKRKPSKVQCHLHRTVIVPY